MPRQFRSSDSYPRTHPHLHLKPFQQPGQFLNKVLFVVPEFLYGMMVGVGGLLLLDNKVIGFFQLFEGSKYFCCDRGVSLFDMFQRNVGWALLDFLLELGFEFQQLLPDEIGRIAIQRIFQKSFGFLQIAGLESEPSCASAI